MKKQLFIYFLTLSMFLGFSYANAQQVVLSHKIHSAGYNKEGYIYEFLGEITNNSGQMVRGVTVNVNYFDAAGEKLKGSNFLTEKQVGEYSDRLSPATDYMAKGTSVPFYCLRFADKINGKVAKYEVVVTAVVIKAPTCAVIENIKSERLYDDATQYYYHKITGQIKCTAGKCFSCKAIIVGYDKNGKITKIKDHLISGADELETGNSKSFEFKFWEDDENIESFAKVEVFPAYRGDWNEE